jgi:deazaflavin-dependent oxidoreductase (nitroreductase family)
MTESAVQQAAAAAVAKHRSLLRTGRDGRVLSALMLPLVWLRPPAGMGVITTTGRKTGKPRRKCVRIIQRGDRAYLVALRPPHLAMIRPSFVQAWVWNIRANPHVQLRIRGGTYIGLAREISAQTERDHARIAFCGTVHPIDYAECVLHLRGLPNRAKVQELHRFWFDTGIPLAIDLRKPS